jgi:hypothetical protein
MQLVQTPCRQDSIVLTCTMAPARQPLHYQSRDLKTEVEPLFVHLESLASDFLVNPVLYATQCCAEAAWRSYCSTHVPEDHHQIQHRRPLKYSTIFQERNLYFAPYVLSYRRSLQVNEHLQEQQDCHHDDHRPSHDLRHATLSSGSDRPGSVHRFCTFLMG